MTKQRQKNMHVLYIFKLVVKNKKIIWDINQNNANDCEEVTMDTFYNAQRFGLVQVKASFNKQQTSKKGYRRQMKS